MKRWARLLTVFPVVGLGWASVYAFEMGTAGAVVFDAGREMDEWSAGTRAQPTAERLAQMRAKLEEARNHAPAYPAAHELLGLLHARSDDWQEYIDQAGVHFLRAIELRPTSAYTWANFAAVRYRAGDTGQRFESALARAAHLGPYEPEVQRMVANYGLAVYHEVAPATRGAIGAMVSAGMKRKPLEMLQIAERRGRLAIACRHLAGSPRLTASKWTQLCQSMEATS